MSTRLHLILCLFISLAFAVVSTCVIWNKSPTIDEPVHFGAAYAHVFLNDDRPEPENPVLWKCWPMLFVNRDAMHVDQSSAPWIETGRISPPQDWIIPGLFERGPEHAQQLINRGRLAMVILGALFL